MNFETNNLACTQGEGRGFICKLRDMKIEPFLRTWFYWEPYKLKHDIVHKKHAGIPISISHLRPGEGEGVWFFNDSNNIEIRDNQVKVTSRGFILNGVRIK
jgi:hypothetical protein